MFRLICELQSMNSTEVLQEHVALKIAGVTTQNSRQVHTAFDLES